MTRIAIFGCGAAGRRAFAHYRATCRIVAFLDNDRTKHGGKLFGAPILNPETFDYNAVDHVFIASMFLDQILVQLLGLGAPSHKIEFVSDDVMMREPKAGRTGRPALAGVLAAIQRSFYVPLRLFR